MKQTHTIDATGKILGRLATQIAVLLNGKHKPTFTRHIDDGDGVVVTNVDKIKVTGKKLDDKIYYRHTGYPGGLRSATLKELWEKRGPAEVLRKAVWNMLPKNKLRKGRMKRLKIKT